MASLVFIIPLAFFATLGAVAIGLFGTVLPWLAGQATWLSWIGSSWFQALAKAAFVVLGFLLPLAGVMTWMERKESALMQDRIGPNRASIAIFGRRIRAFGLVHFVADAMKMLFKEDFVPAKANRLLFGLAPVLALAPVLVVFGVVPFGQGICPGRLGEVMTDETLRACLADPQSPGVLFQVVHTDAGLLFYFAISSLAVYGTTLAGWSSYNKWSLMGGLRAASQMISYEVTMGMAILGAFLVYGTLEPMAIVERQGSSPLHWGLVTQPVGFLLFLAAATAESKRTPFDIPEGESEIIGYFTEYSGLRFGMFYLGEFMEVVFTSAILVTVFLGGWQLPGLGTGGFPLWPLPSWAVALLQVTTFGFKTFFVCWLQIMIRWTLPRMRPDQLMRLGWKQLLPASIVNVLVTAIVILFLGGLR